MEQKNKSVAPKYYDEVWNGQNLSAIDNLFHSDYTTHNRPPWRKPGIAGFKEFMRDQYRMFPDARMKVEDLIAEGDKVVVRFSGTATHRGDLNGPVGLVPATNKKVAWRGISIMRFQGGKIVESWMETDNMGLMKQLGAIPGGN